MNTKQHFGTFGHFSLAKLLNILVILSMLLTSCGEPEKNIPPTPVETPTSEKELEQNNYVPPVYVHPEPVIGERPIVNAQTENSAIESNAPTIMFVENVGQFDEGAYFQAKSELGTIYLADDAIWLTLLETSPAMGTEEEDAPIVNDPQILTTATPMPNNGGDTVVGVNVRLSFGKSNQSSKVEGFNPLKPTVSYFTGDEINKDVPAWGGVRYVDFYPGYNLELTSEAGNLHWEFIQSKTSASDPGVVESEVRLQIEGADSLTLNGDKVEISTVAGNISLPLPVLPSSSQSEPGANSLTPRLDGNEVILPFELSMAAETQPTHIQGSNFTDISVSFGGENTVLAIGDVYNRSTTKSIEAGLITSPFLNSLTDSTVQYSRYISGDANDVVLDKYGSAYIVGNASSLNFPTTPGAFNSSGLDLDVFITKLSPDGEFLEFSATMGGNAHDLGNGIAIDDAQNIYVTGSTWSTDFPVTSGAYDTGNSNANAFVAKLNSTGSDLVYATYLGTSDVQGFDIAVNGDGEAYIVGQVLSSNLPTTTGAYKTVNNSEWDGFVTHFNATGSGLIFSTYLGGTGSDCEVGGVSQECSIALDSNEAIYITGQTSSSGYPTTVGAYDRTYNGGADMFVSKLQPNGSALAYSTYLGGGGNDQCQPKCGIKVGQDGSAYVVGNTYGYFPTTASAYDKTHNGGLDAVVAKLTPSGSGLVYSTYLGASGSDIGHSITVENGFAMVTGETASTNFPYTVDGFQKSFGGGTRDAFVTFLDSDGGGLIYSSYLGGSGDDWGQGISSTSNGNIIATGKTWSNDFPITNGTFATGYVTSFDAVNSVIYNLSVLSSCPCQPTDGTQGETLGPINTRTGGLFYQTDDISLPTSAKELSFFRTYSSLATDLYSSTLGYGWTHNLETRLIFPSDPGGEAGYILFKEHTANQYQFVDNGDGTYSPQPGVLGNLVLNNGQYVLTYPDQAVYTFNSTGRLVTWADAEGRLWNYSYNTSNQIERVSGNGGARYLALGYDGQGRIASVADHTGRSITYTYNGNGDLVSATSLGGGAWQYEYDTAHRLTRVIDPMGNTDERTEYDTQGRAVKQWDGMDQLTGELTYNTDGTTTITYPSGNVETHTYNGRNILSGDEDDAGGATGKTYDQNFRPTTITDAGNDTTTLTWSTDGANLKRVVDTEGNQTDIIYDAFNNPTSVIDAMNHQTTYEYEGALLTKVVDATQGETNYTYTAEGYLESVTDGENVTTTYGYDSFGQRTSMTDEFQNTWGYTYDALGRLVDQTDPLERVTHNEYDAAGRLISVTRNYDPNRAQNADNEWNIVTEYEYDAAGNQILVRDTLDRETKYEYDDADRLIKTIDPELHETISEYNEAGQLVASIDALQHYTYYYYDEAGRLKETKNQLDGTVRTSYNLDGTVASTTDELDRTTYYEYDDLKRVSVVTQPGGGQTKNTYDKLGNLVSVEDPLGQITQYEYDAAGRQIKTIDPDLKETESFYDDAGRLIQTIDARESHTTYEYDEAGRLEKVTDQLGGTTTYEYDETGRKIAVIDANQHRTEYTYDNLDRVVAVTNASGTVYTEYDAVGQVLSRIDANGIKTEFTYTVLGQLKTQKDAADGTTTYGYDVVGNRISVQDANFHTTTMEYDVLNRLIKVIDPELNETETIYDAAGQVITTYDALDKATNYEYNDQGLQIKVEDPLEHETRYTYNVAGQMTSMTDANNIVTAYEYDALGRLKTVIENYQAAVQPTAEINIRTEYTYDENGNRRSIKDGNGQVTNFEYDELNRLTSESDPLGNEWTYTYDALGNRISMTDANGVTTEYAYDDANRLQGMDSDGTEADVSFSYDAGGRRTGMTDAIGTTTWDYDDLNRPISIIDPFDQVVGYSYDAAGNRTGLTYSGKEVGYTYDAANRLKTVSDQGRDTNYQYDPLGRLTNIIGSNGVNSTYTYDDASRLLGLQHATSNSELAAYQYTYDAVGNRIQTTERTPALTGPTVHLTVVDSTGSPLSGKKVYAFDGTTDTGYNATTDAEGLVAITLPEGNYRFRVDVDEIQFWSGAENHCTIGQCDNLLVTIPAPVTIVVNDANGNSLADVSVYAYIGEEYAGHFGVTNTEGTLTLRLPEGDYRFRANYNGTEYWSGSSNHCAVPGCQEWTIVVETPPTAIPTQTETPLPITETPVPTETEIITPEPTATPSPVPSETPLAFQSGNTFAASFGKPLFTLLQTETETGIGLVGEYFSNTMDINGEPLFTRLDPQLDFNWEGASPATGIVPDDFTARWSGQIEAPSSEEYVLGVSADDRVRIWIDGEIYIDDWEDPQNFWRQGAAINFVGGQKYDIRIEFCDAGGWAHSQLYWRTPTSSNIEGWDTVPMQYLYPPEASTIVTVFNTDDIPQKDLNIHAFDNETDTGLGTVTNGNGQAVFTLPDGSYRFRADVNGTQFWSGETNHCATPGCSQAEISIPVQYDSTTLDEFNTEALDSSVWTWQSSAEGRSWSLTDNPGFFQFTLPSDSYYRANLHRSDMGTGDFAIEAGINLDASVSNDDYYELGLLVISSSTEAVSLYVNDDYVVFESNDEYDDITPGFTPGFLRIEKTGSEYAFYYKENTGDHWTYFTSYASSAPVSSVGLYGSADYTTSDVTYNVDYFQLKRADSPYVVVTVSDTDGEPQEGANVSAFNDAADTGIYGITDENGRVGLTLPQGSSYRFAADLNGARSWSGTTNHCSVPGCNQVGITVPNFETVTVTISNTDGDPQEEATISVFDNNIDTGISGVTNGDGQVSLSLPSGSYRFAADLNGMRFWSGETNHCDVSECTQVEITVPNFTTVGVYNNYREGVEGVPVYAFIGDPATSPEPVYAGYERVTNGDGEAFFPLPTGENYHFRADYTAPGTGNSVQFWNNLPEVCDIPGCDHAEIEVEANPVTVTVMNSDSNRMKGLKVYAFDETTYTGYTVTTNMDGQSTFNLPDGSYRFRADFNGTQFWSGEVNHCDISDCDQVEITVPGHTVAVFVLANYPIGVTVYAFDGDEDLNYHQVTNEDGEDGVAFFTLPEGGDYHFRADYTAPGAGNSVSFWNIWPEVCAVPECDHADIDAWWAPVTVTVLDADSAPQEGLNVFAFDGDQNTGIYLTTDANGQVTFTLPFGNYRFRTDFNGESFWSGTENHCDPNAECEASVISFPKPVTVSVRDAVNTAYPNLPVYVFDGTTYTGRYGTTDASGKVTMTLPPGNYHFRTDYNGVQYWSNPLAPAEENDCSVPGCGNVSITLPGGFVNKEVTIDYTYDPLYRLTTADYSNGDAYAYTYDAVGNRLTQESTVYDLSSTATYNYDIANRLADVNGVAYTYDANGNLLNDGVDTYTYDPANRLTSVNDTGSYAYNGLGDRLSQNGVNYTLDLNTGLTQVLSDGTTTYTYGLGRISQQQGTTPEYFLGDALGSVRQLTSQNGAVTYAASYSPYGVVTQSGGVGQSTYGFTGEQQSGDMVYLRARYLNVNDARFLSRDTWSGDINNPITLNRWAYANANPIRYTDPSGNSVTQSIISTTLRRAGIGSASGGGNGYGIECASTGDVALGDFWLGFWKEAYRVHIWFNPVPSVREDVAIKSNESTSMLLGRLTADIVSIAIGGVEIDTAGLLFLAGPAECVAGILVGGVGEFVTCPGAAVQMAGAAILVGQAVVSGSIAVAGGVQVLAILSGRSGGGRFSPEQAEVIRLAKAAKAKGGISTQEAQDLLNEARRVGLNSRGPEIHVSRPFNKLHIHIGTVDHIIVNP